MFSSTHTLASEAAAIKEILKIFGEASGLRINLSKCSITPVYGADQAMPELQQILGCQVVEFPTKYLGLPLGTRKISKTYVQQTVDAVSRKLLACHGSLMARSG